MSAPRSGLSRLPLRPVFVCLAALIAGLSGCHKGDTAPSTAESYVVNGAVWAYGTVQLAPLDVPGVVMVARKTAVQPLVSGQPAPAYQLYGAVQAATGATDAGRRDIAYVDLHPTRSRMLAYSYQLEYSYRFGRIDEIDVWAMLKQPGRSYFNRQRVYLGMAVFQKGADIAALAPADGIKLSMIADGVFSGQWALHYPERPQLVTRPWQGMCPKTVQQMPGQNPSQNPGQYESCNALPAQQDLCNGDPTQASCRPPAPVQQRGYLPVGGGSDETIVKAYDTADLESLEEDSDVYALAADVKEGKITFVADTLAAETDEDNAALCAKRFYAIARTVDRQVNASCVLKPAPAAPRDGKLACALTVAFERAETYLERVCDVTAVFKTDKGATAEQHTVQVLKR
jgi:hypothetical protein